jgi:hypothetical protein
MTLKGSEWTVSHAHCTRVSLPDCTSALLPSSLGLPGFAVLPGLADCWPFVTAAAAKLPSRRWHGTSVVGEPTASLRPQSRRDFVRRELHPLLWNNA